MKINTTENKNQVLFWFLILLFLSILIRIIFILISHPGIQNDTPSYLALAHEIAEWNLVNDNGFRTPVYPLFILLFNYEPELIRIGQMILGLLIVSCMYWMAWNITKSIKISFLAGSFYGFNLAQIYFESNILTETLATFFLVTSIFIYLRGVEFSNNNRYSMWMVLTGVLGALAALTRPLFLFIPFLFCLINFIINRKQFLIKRIWWSSLLIIPAVLLIGGWSIFNYFRIGYFGPTTFTGYGLADHSITFIKYAPEQYSKIRDVYMDIQAREGTNVINVFDGYSQIQQATGETFVQISKTLTQMSLFLITQHPLLYAQSVIVTWIKFWNEPGWWTWPFINSDKLQLFFAYAWRFQKYFLVILINFPFLLLVVGSSIITIIKRSWQWLWKDKSVMIMTLVILVSSIVQAIMERGDVTRYAIPLQPLIACVLLVTIWKIITERKIKYQLEGNYD